MTLVTTGRGVRPALQTAGIVSVVDTYPCPACGGVAERDRGVPVVRSRARPGRRRARAAQPDPGRAGRRDPPARDDRVGAAGPAGPAAGPAHALTAALARQLAAANEAGAARTATPPPARAGPRGRAEHGAEPDRRPAQTAPRPRHRGRRQPPRGRRPGRPPPTRPRARRPRRARRRTPCSPWAGSCSAIAAVVFAGVFYSTTQPAGGPSSWPSRTTLALGMPVLLARRRLTATAETIAGLGLLLVLLDGYVAYSANLAGLARALAPAVRRRPVRPGRGGRARLPPGHPPAGAAVRRPARGPAAAAAGRRAPRRSAATGSRPSFAVVAAQNLAAVVLLRREPVRRRRGRPRDARRCPPVLAADAARAGLGAVRPGAGRRRPGWPTASLVRADTVAEAVRALARRPAGRGGRHRGGPPVRPRRAAPRRDRRGRRGRDRLR